MVPGKGVSRPRAVRGEEVCPVLQRLVGSGVERGEYANLTKKSVPVPLHTDTADPSTFPSTRKAWLQAGGARIRNVDIVGGNHYLAGRPALVEQVADEMVGVSEGDGYTGICS